MDRPVHRRRFLGRALAFAGGVAVGAGAGLAGRAARLEWEQGDAGPEASVGLRLTGVGWRRSGAVEVALRVETPRGVVEIDGGVLEVRGGEARGEVDLRWPFGDEVVPGEYRYFARARVDDLGGELGGRLGGGLGGRWVETAAPASYRVRRLAFFS